jgi:hypothetical protein
MSPTSAELQASVMKRFPKVARWPDEEKKLPVGPACVQAVYQWGGCNEDHEYFGELANIEAGPSMIKLKRAYEPVLVCPVHLLRACSRRSGELPARLTGRARK